MWKMAVVVILNYGDSLYYLKTEDREGSDAVDASPGVHPTLLKQRWTFA